MWEGRAWGFRVEAHILGLHFYSPLFGPGNHFRRGLLLLIHVRSDNDEDDVLDFQLRTTLVEDDCRLNPDAKTTSNSRKVKYCTSLPGAPPLQQEPTISDD